MAEKFTHFCCENVLRLLCIRKHEKKNKLKKAGYIVDKPHDYHPDLYSKTTRSCWDVTVYSKYGKSYSIEEVYKKYKINSYNTKTIKYSNYTGNNLQNNKKRKRRKKI